MRLLTFTILALVVAMAIHWGLEQVPYVGPGFRKELIFALHLLLPVMATACLAFAMRIWNWYVVFLAIASPVVSVMLMFLVAIFVFDAQIDL